MPKVVSMLKRGDSLIGTVYKDESKGSLPYYAIVEIHSATGTETRKSTYFFDEDLAMDYISKIFSEFNTFRRRAL